MVSTVGHTLHQAAAELGVHYMTIYRHVRSGRLPATRTPTGWSVNPDDLRRYAEGGRPDRADRQRQFEDRLIAHDDAALWRVVQDELASGKSGGDVLSELIIPSLGSIGERWRSGEVTVLDEHQASSAASVVVARLGPHIRRSAPVKSPETAPTIVVGSPSGDTHALATAIVSDLLRANGIAAIELGADTPAESFAEVVAGGVADGVSIDAVAICVYNKIDDPDSIGHAIVKETVAAIRAADPSTRILVGGQGSIGASIADLGCDLVSSDINDLVELTKT